MTTVPSIELAASVAFVRSAGMCRLLRDRLGETVPAGVNRARAEADAVRDALVETLFQPRANGLRRDDAEALIDDLLSTTRRDDGLYDLCNEHAGGVLAHAAFTYLQDRGGYYEVETSNLERYCALLRYVDPSLLIGIRHVDLLIGGDVVAVTLEKLMRRQTPLAMPISDIDHPYADNHVHLYGVGLTAHPLAALLFAKGQLKKEPKVSLDPTLGIGGDLDCRGLERLMCDAALYMVEFACRYDEARDRYVGSDEKRTDHKQFISAGALEDRLSSSRDLSIAQTLTLMMARAVQENNAASALQFLMTLALYLHVRVNKSYRRLHYSVLSYINAMHLLRSVFVVAGSGLRTFVDYYRNEPRFNGEAFADRDRWRSLIGNGRDMVDAKIARHRPRDLSRYARDAARAVADHASPQPYGHAWHRYHLSYHFLRDDGGKKREIGNDGSKSILYSNQRHGVYATAQTLRRTLGCVEKVEADRTSAPIQYQNVMSWIRSFDVAGDETVAPIEVFAPALRFLREKPIVERSWRPEAAISERRTFSIHAGEDFSHILSGLRHIEETVEFCGLGVDDRLGHALALGMDPHEWARAQDVAMVPLGAHVDNLVWLWHHATQLAHKAEKIAGILPRLHRRLGRFLHELYPDEVPEVETLYRAWRLRRNCPQRLLSTAKGDANLYDMRYWVPDLVADPGLRERDEYHWHVRYLRSIRGITHGDMANKKVRIRLGRDEASGADRGKLVDHTNNDELEAIIAIQDHLMHVIDDKGIVIEACPTSNVYIGRFENYGAHPVFRWNPPDAAMLAPGGKFNRFGLRRGPVAVCLSTDDPAIMPTTILAEHHLMREAAIRAHGVSRAAAQDWINRVRITGVELFRRTHKGCRLLHSDQAE